MHKAIDSQGSTAPKIKDVAKSIEKALKGNDDKVLERPTAEAVAKAVKYEGPWGKVKRGGLDGVPRGEARKTAEKLLEQLRSVGIYVAPVGDLEGWAPGIGGHGPRWAARALEERVHEQDGPAADFIRELAASLLEPSSA